MSTTPRRSTDGSLTFDLRGLVWAIGSEVAVITNLCSRIDEHVRVLNVVRAEAAGRLELLDDLVAAAEDDDLRSWLVTSTAGDHPAVAELFPDRLYTD